MKVFISWSGERSREVASVLRDWLSCVLQAIKPWVSTRDIDRGALWFNEINGQLQEATVGIICLTQQNKNQPWILFEAGALAKGLSTSRVLTLLIDLEAGDVKDPLAQFNHTLPSKDGLHSLVHTLNAALGPAGLDAKVLEQVFETYWPQFERQFEAAMQSTPESPADPVKGPDEAIAELIALTKTVANRVARIEQREVHEPTEQSSYNVLPSYMPLTKEQNLSHSVAFRDMSAREMARKMLNEGRDVQEVRERLAMILGARRADRMVDSLVLASVARPQDG